MSSEVGGIHGISEGDVKALMVSQRKLSAIVRLLTFDQQSALLSLGDLQGDALRIVRDYADQIGEILEASQKQPK